MKTIPWLIAGLRTPFAKLDGPLKQLDAISLSVPVVQAMAKQPANKKPDLLIWGAVAPNLGWSNIAREVLIDASLNQTIPACTTIMACSTSMAGAFQAAGMLKQGALDLALVGGVESMSRIQIGLNQNLSDWVHRFFQRRSIGERLEVFTELNFRDIRLHIPSVTNRATKKSMGEHTEIMAKEWKISRRAQDKFALLSHERAVRAQRDNFFESLVIPIGDLKRDTNPRTDTSLEKLERLQPAFDKTSGQGTLTAGNSSPLTDGAAAIWVANDLGLAKLPTELPRAKLIDWEMAAVDIFNEGLLMAPAYAIPRLLIRNRLTYKDIDLWELHEAFSAQVLCNVAALESKNFLANKVGINESLGEFPWERLNPNGGSIALGHPFAATGARILSQAVKELFLKGQGRRAIVSICADGGLGTVCLIET